MEAEKKMSTNNITRILMNVSNVFFSLHHSTLLLVCASSEVYKKHFTSSRCSFGMQHSAVHVPSQHREISAKNFKSVFLLEGKTI